jgi:hypothetical protein
LISAPPWGLELTAPSKGFPPEGLLGLIYLFFDSISDIGGFYVSYFKIIAHILSNGRGLP